MRFIIVVSMISVFMFMGCSADGQVRDTGNPVTNNTTQERTPKIPMGFVKVHYMRSKSGPFETIYYVDGKEVARNWHYPDYMHRNSGESGKIPDGVFKSYYSAGGLMEETSYKDGKPEGVSKTYFESGKIQSEESILNGEEIYKRYLESGVVDFVNTYRNGQKINSKQYDETGKLISDTDYPLGEITKERKIGSK